MNNQTFVNKETRIQHLQNVIDSLEILAEEYRKISYDMRVRFVINARNDLRELKHMEEISKQ